MKLYYGLKNLRSINLDSVELRPLTILLGENNVGKSTVLRSFPLLKQTIEANNGISTKWNGKYVDFGDYSTAVKFGQENQGIVFKFGIEDFAVCNELLYYGRQQAGLDTDFEIQMKDRADVSVLLTSDGYQTYRKESIVSIPEHNINLSIRFSKSEKLETALFNGEKLPVAFQNILFRFPHNHLLSQVQLLKPVRENVIFTDILEVGNLFLGEVGKILVSNLDIDANNPSILTESLKILEYPVLDKNSLEKLAKSAPQPFKEFYLKQEKTTRIEFEKFKYNMRNIYCSCNI